MSDKRIVLQVTVLADKDADPMKMAERLFDFLASDPDDVFPDINEVEGYDGRTTERDR